MRVCVCVCACVHVYVHVRPCVRVCTCVCVRVCMYMYVHACMRMCMLARDCFENKRSWVQGPSERIPRFIVLFALGVRVYMYPLNMECGVIGGLITLSSS